MILVDFFIALCQNGFNTLQEKNEQNSFRDILSNIDIIYGTLYVESVERHNYNVHAYTHVSRLRQLDPWKERPWTTVR